MLADLVETYTERLLPSRRPADEGGIITVLQATPVSGPERPGFLPVFYEGYRNHAEVARVPDLGAPLTAILARRLSSVYLAIAAAMTGDRDLVVEAMLADGGVTDPDRAGALSDALLAEQARFLPRFA